MVLFRLWNPSGRKFTKVAPFLTRSLHLAHVGRFCSFDYYESLSNLIRPESAGCSLKNDSVLIHVRLCMPAHVALLTTRASLRILPLPTYVQALQFAILAPKSFLESEWQHQLRPLEYENGAAFTCELNQRHVSMHAAEWSADGYKALPLQLTILQHLHNVTMPNAERVHKPQQRNVKFSTHLLMLPIDALTDGRHSQSTNCQQVGASAEKSVSVKDMFLLIHDGISNCGAAFGFRWSVNEGCAQLACGKAPAVINLPCAHATYCAEHAEVASLQRVTSVSTVQLAQCGTATCYECPQCGNLAFTHTKVQSSLPPDASLMKSKREITAILSKKAAHFEQWTSMTFKHFLDLQSDRP